MNGQVASSRLVLTGGPEKTPPPGPSLHPSPTPMWDVGALGSFCLTGSERFLEYGLH